jgi:hypothetical protein
MPGQGHRGSQDALASRLAQLRAEKEEEGEKVWVEEGGGQQKWVVGRKNWRPTNLGVLAGGLLELVFFCPSLPKLRTGSLEEGVAGYTLSE